MKYIKFLSITILIFLISLQSQAQYIERPEVKDFEGVWITTGQGYDSIILEMTAKMKVPIIKEKCEKCFITDILLMDIKCYSAGEIVYQVENLDQKYNNQYFIAIVESPEDTNQVKFNFQYADDNNTSENGKGKGTLLYKDGKLEMKIDLKEFLEFKTPDNDHENIIGPSISIPRKLDFVKKIRVILL